MLGIFVARAGLCYSINILVASILLPFTFKFIIVGASS